MYNPYMSALSRRDFLRLGTAALFSTAFSRLYHPPSDPAPASTLYHGSRRFRKVAMTYDDCWHPEIIDQLTEVLKPYPGFHYTFFAVGDAIDKNEELRPGFWQRLTDAGHELGYHTYHHVNPQVMPTESLLADFDRWMATLNQKLASPARVHFARPPYDDLSLSFQELCRERGLVPTLFSAGYEAPTLVESLLLASRTQNGDVVQMHTYQDPPNGRFDVEITRAVVPFLADAGFSLVTLSQLYDDVLREEISSKGCEVGPGGSLTRTCLD